MKDTAIILTGSAEWRPRVSVNLLAKIYFQEPDFLYKKLPKSAKMQRNESHFLIYNRSYVTLVGTLIDQSIILSWVDEWVWLIDWVSKWPSTSLILKPDKNMDQAVWAKNLTSTRKQKLNFPHFFFFMNECWLINKCLFSQVTGDSGAQMPWFDLSIVRTVHVSLNISALNLLIPGPNPQIGLSNKSVVKNWC